MYYKNVFEADLPAADGATVKDGKYIPPTREEIELGINISELQEIKGLIFETIRGGKRREVEVEPKESKKNETM